MSRPFSYSDENFTVIGNVLFCHIKIKKQYEEKDPILEIPPAIYDHMLITTQKFVESSTGIGFVFTGPAIDVGLKKTEDGKHFLFSNRAIHETGAYLVGFFILKDI